MNSAIKVDFRTEIEALKSEVFMDVLGNALLCLPMLLWMKAPSANEARLCKG